MATYNKKLEPLNPLSIILFIGFMSCIIWFALWMASKADKVRKEEIIRKRIEEAKAMPTRYMRVNNFSSRVGDTIYFKYSKDFDTISLPVDRKESSGILILVD